MPHVAYLVVVSCFHALYSSWYGSRNVISCVGPDGAAFGFLRVKEFAVSLAVVFFLVFWGSFFFRYDVVISRVLGGFGCAAFC